MADPDILVAGGWTLECFVACMEKKKTKQFHVR